MIRLRSWRWSELLLSEWKEYVKQGSTLTLPEVLFHNLCDPIKSRIINIDTCLSVYAKFFGIGSIRVVSYDEVLGSGADLFDHFALSSLHISNDTPQTQHWINRSLTTAQTELLRVFNAFSKDAGVDGSGLHRFFNLQHLPAPLTDLLQILEQYKTYYEVKDAAVSDTLRRNRLHYADCALPPVAQTFFYELKTVQLDYIKTDYMLLPNFVDKVRRVWNALLDVQRSRPNHLP